MPRYAFKCDRLDCQHAWDEDMKLDDFTSTLTCPRCDGIARIQYKPTQFILKGSGWAADNYVTKGSLKDVQ